MAPHPELEALDWDAAGFSASFGPGRDEDALGVSAGASSCTYMGWGTTTSLHRGQRSGPAPFARKPPIVGCSVQAQNPRPAKR